MTHRIYEIDVPKRGNRGASKKNFYKIKFLDRNSRKGATTELQHKTNDVRNLNEDLRDRITLKVGIQASLKQS